MRSSRTYTALRNTVGGYMGTPISSSSHGRPRAGGQGNEPPSRAQDDGFDLAKSASIHGVTGNTLRNALGPPPPDWPVAAERLGITEQALRKALGFDQ